MILMGVGIVLSFTMRPDRALDVSPAEAGEGSESARKFV
jgi:hypothetical protein